MKLARVLGFLIILGSSVIPARADVTDPKIIVDEPLCTFPPDVAYTGGILDVDLSSSSPLANLCYEGATPLTTLTIEFAPASGESYSFESNIFSMYTFSFPPGLVEVTFSDGEILPDNGFEIEAEGLNEGETLDLTVSVTPELSTFYLFLTGMVPMIWLFGRRFRGTVRPG